LASSSPKSFKISRHYALTPAGEALHSNASMSASAVMTALRDAGLGLESLQFLATATNQGDLLVPGHGTPLPAYVSDFLAASDGLSLMKSFMLIKGPRLRRCIVNLVEEIAGDDD
jgi:hypothetical protein